MSSLDSSDNEMDSSIVVGPSTYDTSELKKAELRRKTLRSTTTTVINRIEELLKVSPLSVEDIEIQLALLSRKENDLDILDNKIMDLTPADDPNLTKKIQKIEEYKDKIVLSRTKAQRKIKTVLTGINSDGVETNSNVNANGNNVTNYYAIQQEGGGLPPPTLLKFNGDPTEYTGFWSQFESMVDGKTNMTKVQKFVYLRGYLGGAALKILAGMKPSEENYNEAKELLKIKYGKKKIIEHAHMKNLSLLRPITDSNDLKALREFLDVCEVNIRSLKSLGVNTAANGAFLCPKLIGCLPWDIRLKYAEQQGEDAEWDVDALIDFLRVQVEQRETCEMFGNLQATPAQNNLTNDRSDRNQIRYRREGERDISKTKDNYGHNPNNASASVFNTSVETRNTYCIFCKSTTHNSTSCTGMTLEQKRKYIRDTNRCWICLRYGHDSKGCQSKFNSCKICKRRHNAAICEKNEANKRTKEPTKEKSEVDKISVGLVGLHPKISGGTVLLQTAHALAKRPSAANGLVVRCLLDPGSQASFIQEEISRKLKLQVIGECQLQIYNFGN